MCDVLQYALSDMDREYLSRQLLEGMVYRISKDKISIENANTIFISCERPVLYPRSEFNSMLKTLRELAKTRVFVLRTLAQLSSWSKKVGIYTRVKYIVTWLYMMKFTKTVNYLKTRNSLGLLG